MEGKTEQERIAQRGYRDGRVAGGWVTDGNGTRETYERLAFGIAAGDPEILDELPDPQLGGEWADSPTWSQILAEEECEDSDDGRNDLLDIYQEQFGLGVTDEVNRACKIALAERRAS